MLLPDRRWAGTSSRPARPRRTHNLPPGSKASGGTTRPRDETAFCSFPRSWPSLSFSLEASGAGNEHSGQSQEKNLDVERNRPISNVEKIVGDALRDGRVASPPVDLGPARDTALDVVPRHIFGNFFSEAFEKEGAFRPWPNNAHFALQHIQDLRKFIKVGSAQPAAQRRNVLVVVHGP